MFGEAKYLEQKFPNAVYSITYWGQSNATVISIDHSSEGAIAILFNSFMAYSTATAPQTFTIFDAKGNVPLFTAAVDGANAVTFSLTNFHHCVTTNQVRLRCNNINVQFSVGYQYLNHAVK